MKQFRMFRMIVVACLCCAFCGVCLTGCSHDTSVKQEAGAGGKGLTPEEKKAKKDGE